MAGYLSVQLLPQRVRIWTLPASRRACIRYPSSFNSWSQWDPSGALSTSFASCGLIQVGGEGSSALWPARIVPVGATRADFIIGVMYQNFALWSVRHASVIAADRYFTSQALPNLIGDPSQDPTGADQRATAAATEAICAAAWDGGEETARRTLRCVAS